MKTSDTSYAVITPVKNEERFIGQTIASMLLQNMRPVIWVIVDDASTDGTSRIIKEQTVAHSWIRYLLYPGEAARKTGSAEVCAFNYGFTSIRHFDFDIIVKLDGDVRFEGDYFERLVSKFDSNDSLGIASGIYLEAEKNSWKPVAMPAYHAAGASKSIRRNCFEQIDGFIAERGWDTIDEIRAQTRGWETMHFPDIQFYHLRKEGVGMGLLSTNVMHGEIFYRTGGSIVFFIVKVFHRMLKGKPFFWAGAAMVYGYIAAILKRKKLLVTVQEASAYRSLLNRRINRAIKQFVSSSS